MSTLSRWSVFRKYFNNIPLQALLSKFDHNISFVERWIDAILHRKLKSMRSDTFLSLRKTILDLLVYLFNSNTYSFERRFKLELCIEFVDSLLPDLLHSFINLPYDFPDTYAQIERLEETKVKVPLWFFTFLSLRDSHLDLILKQKQFVIFWEEMAHLVEELKLRKEIDDWRKKYVDMYLEYNRLKLKTSYLAEKSELETSDYVFHFDGENWRIRYEGDSLPLLPALIGLFYIKLLLQTPRKPVPVELMQELNYDSRPELVAESSMEMSKRETKKAGLNVNIKSAQKKNRKLTFKSPEALEKHAKKLTVELTKAREEGDQIVEREIQGQLDSLGALYYRQTGASERLESSAKGEGDPRLNVAKAVTRARYRIKKHNKEFYEYLKLTIRTGNTCIYQPTNLIPWKF